jgi:hypothetical protein
LDFSRVVGRPNTLLGAIYGVVAVCFELRGSLTLIANELVVTIMSTGILQKATRVIALPTNFAAGFMVANSQRLQRDHGRAGGGQNPVKAVPFCSHCKKIQDKKVGRMPIESQVGRHTEALFRHDAYAECMKQHYRELEEAET